MKNKLPKEVCKKCKRVFIFSLKNNLCEDCELKVEWEEYKKYVEQWTGLAYRYKSFVEWKENREGVE